MSQQTIEITRRVHSFHYLSRPGRNTDINKTITGTYPLIKNSFDIFPFPILEKEGLMVAVAINLFIIVVIIELSVLLRYKNRDATQGQIRDYDVPK